MNKVLALALLLALAACATPAQRISTKLSELGVPVQQADCMGRKLSDRLSYEQLKRLNDVARESGDRLERMSIRDITRTLDRTGDPALVAEVVRAGVGCVL